MEKITTQYKGFTIEFSEFDESWSCEIAQRAYSKQKLADVKKKIDAFVRAESEFKDVEAIYMGRSWRSSPGARVTITSVADDGDVWVKHNKDGQREKVSKGYKNTLKKITPENMDKLANMKGLNEKIDQMKAEIVTIEESMETIFTEEQ